MSPANCCLPSQMGPMRRVASADSHSPLPEAT